LKFALVPIGGKLIQQRRRCLAEEETDRSDELDIEEDQGDPEMGESLGFEYVDKLVGLTRLWN
jgi:hypothetical protein